MKKAVNSVEAQVGYCIHFTYDLRNHRHHEHHQRQQLGLSVVTAEPRRLTSATGRSLGVLLTSRPAADR